MSHEIDYETLSAYVDGELPEEERRHLESALAENAGLRDEVRRLREDSALVRASFNEILTSEIPDRVLQTVAAGADGAGSGTARAAFQWTMRLQGWWPAMVAASLAAVIVGAAGFLLLDYRLEQRIAQLSATKEADQALYDDALFTALEKHASGKTIAWTNPDTGTTGNITPVRTFKSKSGLWCREFDSMLTREEGLESLRAIACREPQGVWKTRAVLYGES